MSQQENIEGELDMGNLFDTLTAQDKSDLSEQLWDKFGVAAVEDEDGDIVETSATRQEWIDIYPSIERVVKEWL